jgi:ribosomal protein S18 acetylase RimI-like enzyme
LTETHPRCVEIDEGGTMSETNGKPPAGKEADLHYLHRPTRFHDVRHKIEFLPVPQLLEDDETCQAMWDMLAAQFKTRNKFLAIWPSVRFVAVHGRGRDLAGFLLVSTPLNWQIDYVAVHPTRRHQGIAAALVNETVNQAVVRKVPYMMLTSREGLRPLYESCGFEVVARNGPPAVNVPFPSTCAVAPDLLHTSS